MGTVMQMLTSICAAALVLNGRVQDHSTQIARVLFVTHAPQQTLVAPNEYCAGTVSAQDQHLQPVGSWLPLPSPWHLTLLNFNVGWHRSRRDGTWVRT